MIEYDKLALDKNSADEEAKCLKTAKSEYDKQLEDIKTQLKQKSDEYDRLLMQKRSTDKNTKSKEKAEKRALDNVADSASISLPGQCLVKREQSKEELVKPIKKGSFKVEDISINKIDKRQKAKRSSRSRSTHGTKEPAEKIRKKGKVFEVKKLLTHKMMDGKRYFQIRWKNYDSKSDSWECEDNLQCPILLDEYKKKNKLI